MRIPHSMQHLFKSKAALPTRAKHAATPLYVHEYTLDRNAFICPPQDLCVNVHGSYVHNTKTWKQRQCSSTVEKINKSRWSYNSTQQQKRTGYCYPQKTWMKLSDIILSKRSQTQKRINFVIPFT